MPPFLVKPKTAKHPRSFRCDGVSHCKQNLIGLLDPGLCCQGEVCHPIKTGANDDERAGGQAKFPFTQLDCLAALFLAIP